MHWTPRVIATAVTTAIVLAGCATSDPLADPATPRTGDTIVVGSQAYYSNEIVAEIYAQALEDAGFTVDRRFSIGQRDAYMPEIESGAISVFPEYTGNLLQYFDADTTARATEEVYEALQSALPDGLTVLDQASATDQDSYTVTQAFADQYQLSTIADLANVTEPLTLGGPPELAERPYGPQGLLATYGIEVGFTSTGDTTVEDLVAGTVMATLGVQEQGGDTHATLLTRFLRDREMLLVLDNFEHLLPDGAAFLTDLLKNAPQLKLLVTSRERLKVGAECFFALSVLAV